MAGIASILGRIGTVLVGLAFIASGAFKFMGGYVFQYIEYQSGIELFHPLVSSATGLAEIAVGAMLLLARTRLYGAIGAAAIMIGAIGFHLSPWLGISTPNGLTEGAAAPWDAADFVSETSPGAFIGAIILLAAAGVIAMFELRRQGSQPG